MKEVIIETKDDLTKLCGNNTIVGSFDFVRSKVIFKGENNVLIFAGEDNPGLLEDSTIIFHGNNSIVFMGENHDRICHRIDLQICGDNYCYIGKDTIFAGFTRQIRIMCAPKQNVFIGDNCLFADGTRIKTTDGHPLYELDNKSGKYIATNQPGSIYIGDHVWIGLESLIMKDTEIGSGASIGANSFCKSQKISSNSLYVGTKAKRVKENVFHRNTLWEVDTPSEENPEKYIYGKHSGYMGFTALKANILSKKDMNERIEYFKTLHKMSGFENMDRFFISNSEADTKVTK